MNVISMHEASLMCWPISFDMYQYERIIDSVFLLFCPCQAECRSWHKLKSKALLSFWLAFFSSPLQFIFPFRENSSVFLTEKNGREEKSVKIQPTPKSGLSFGKYRHLRMHPYYHYWNLDAKPDLNLKIFLAILFFFLSHTASHLPKLETFFARVLLDKMYQYPSYVIIMVVRHSDFFFCEQSCQPHFYSPWQLRFRTGLRTW